MELIGQQFGNIRITEVVGQGGMGDVYGGYDEKLQRKVAVKVVSPDQRLEREARERLLREARALSRLDHPNICRIYDYIQSETVDLLVLEYIDGRTLADIEEKMSRGEKLRIASAVAGVLETAHRAGIVHRDLKPENVMLTRTGEVKVLDFGLARWLQRARTQQLSGRQKAVNVVPLHGRGADTIPVQNEYDTSPLATAVGITLGTPLYMSPEQARGEELTPASDMFSFGLLLQFLFTGSDPHPMGLSAREVLLRVSRGETNPVQGAPGDVTTLINRLKQLAPADRPTAGEALRRLKRLASKPQRFAQRAAAAAVAAVLAFGGWRYTVDLQNERAKAVAAQQEAERRRAQLETMVEFMLGDLRKKLEPVGRLDVLDDVGQRALAYFESLDPKVMSADALARNAKALNQLGEVRLGQGNTPEALRMFRQAETLTTQAVRREPRNGPALLVHGATEFWIGNALSTQGRTDEALQHMQKYMQVGETLAKLDPANREYLLERAYGNSGVAAMLEAKGELEAALRHYRVSADVKRELARREPDDIDAQAEVARAHNKIGVVLYKMGDVRGALEHAEREVSIYRQLVQREPKQNQWRQRLAASMGYLGRALDESGRKRDALALWREELALQRELVALDPTNVSARRALAICARRIAADAGQDGDHTRAVALFTEARTLIAGVMKQAPTRMSFAVDAAQIDLAYARYLVSTGKRAQAVELLRDTLRRLEAMPSDDLYARSQLASTALLLGELLEPSDPAAAAAQWQRAEEALVPLVAKNASPADLANWFRVLLHRGRLPEARALLGRMRDSGVFTTDLEQLCRAHGC
ncbi:MAG TPA: protein kinase [Thermoanaerobaculia bacterium]|nr:protein kinase [Thermoanaerobaculia bacterium]